jgi:hypothetical protein
VRCGWEEARAAWGARVVVLAGGFSTGFDALATGGTPLAERAGALALAAVSITGSGLAVGTESAARAGNDGALATADSTGCVAKRPTTANAVTPAIATPPAISQP